MSLFPTMLKDITITKDGNEYKLNVTKDDIRKIFLEPHFRKEHAWTKN